jgi:hypothetical protein
VREPRVSVPVLDLPVSSRVARLGRFGTPPISSTWHKARGPTESQDPSITPPNANQPVRWPPAVKSQFARVSSMPSAFDNYPSVRCAPMDMISCTSHGGDFNIRHRLCSRWMNQLCSNMSANNSTKSQNPLPRPSTIASACSAVCIAFIPDIRCPQGRTTSSVPTARDPRLVTAAHSA